MDLINFQLIQRDLISIYLREIKADLMANSLGILAKT